MSSLSSGGFSAAIISQSLRNRKRLSDGTNFLPRPDSVCQRVESFGHWEPSKSGEEVLTSRTRSGPQFACVDAWDSTHLCMLDQIAGQNPSSDSGTSLNQGPTAHPSSRQRVLTPGSAFAGTCNLVEIEGFQNSTQNVHHIQRNLGAHNGNPPPQISHSQIEMTENGHFRNDV